MIQSNIYEIVLIIHCWFRWLVLGLCCWLVVRLCSTGEKWSGRDEKWAWAFGLAFSTQIVIGSFLYLLSPLPWTAFALGRPFLKNRILRFFAIEHITTMVLAWMIYVIAGMWILLTDPEGRQKKLRQLTIFTLIWIILAIPWPGLIHGRPLIRWPVASTSSAQSGTSHPGSPQPSAAP